MFSSLSLKETSAQANPQQQPPQPKPRTLARHPKLLLLPAPNLSVEEAAKIKRRPTGCRGMVKKNQQALACVVVPEFRDPSGTKRNASLNARPAAWTATHQAGVYLQGTGQKGAKKR